MEKIILDKLKEINLKLYEIQKNQKELSKRYDLLLKEQEKENKDIYKILQQLLLKDVLNTYKNEISNFLSQKNMFNENNISKCMEIKNTTIKEQDSDMVFVKGGIHFPSFLEQGKVEKQNNNEISVFDLYVSKYQVTQDKWEKYMKTNPSEFRGDKRPVESISWIEALIFCNKMSEEYGVQPAYKIENNKLIKIVYKNGEEVYPDLADFSRVEGYRLPTEIEWGWFARGGEIAIQNNTFNTKYAGSENINEVAWYKDNSEKQTHTVGLKKPNELGLYDCTGNVWEWCYDTVSKECVLGNKPYIYNENTEYRRLRGCSWNFSISSCVLAYHIGDYCYCSRNYYGLRVVRTANPQK